MFLFISLCTLHGLLTSGTVQAYTHWKEDKHPWAPVATWMSSLEAFRPETYINFSLEAFGRVAPKASFWTPPLPEKKIKIK